LALADPAEHLGIDQRRTRRRPRRCLVQEHVSDLISLGTIPFSWGFSWRRDAQGKAQTQTNEQAQGKTGTTTNQAQGNSQTQTNEQAQGKIGTTTNQAQGSNEQDQGKTASINNVTVEQKTQITNVIKETKVEPVSNVDFDISVGVEVPRQKIHLHRLPSKIVKIVPAYEGYEYFVLADGRIVIVDPNTYKIVLVLT
jgi:hypothetical protein